MAEWIAIGVLAEYVFCPRSAWFAHAAGLFQPNEYTVEGEHVHRRVHAQGHELQGTKKVWRRVLLYSRRLGLVGYADAVEYWDGKYYPVEYKRGKVGEKLSDQVQICAQAMCLEEMTDERVEVGFIYYVRSRRRVPVRLDSSLRHLTVSSLREVRELLREPQPPHGAYAPRCRGCAQYPVCLPDADLKQVSWEVGE